MGFPNIGIALGAGVEQMNKERANDRADRSLQLQEQDAQRRQEVHTAQMVENNRRNSEHEAAKMVFADALPVFQGGWQKAAEHLAERYNANDDGIGYNDGKQVKFQVQPNGIYVTPLNPDGSGGTTAFYTPQDVMREHIRATHARLATINDSYGKQFLTWIDAQTKAELDRAEKSEKAAYTAGRDAVKDSQFEQELAVKQERNRLYGDHQSRSGGPSLAQQRGNAEIDDARTYLDGLTPEEIKRKSSSFTATGRENPEYDERISRASKLANRRKIGEDDAFDLRGTKHQELQPAPAYDRADVAKRFRADRAMDHYRLGRDTPNGVEVLDKAGKVIGHFD